MRTSLEGVKKGVFDKLGLRSSVPSCVGHSWLDAAVVSSSGNNDSHNNLASLFVSWLTRPTCPSFYQKVARPTWKVNPGH